jgi:hypothetical protein
MAGIEQNTVVGEYNMENSGKVRYGKSKVVECHKKIWGGGGYIDPHFLDPCTSWR